MIALEGQKMIAHDASPEKDVDLAIKPRRGDRLCSISVAPPGLAVVGYCYPALTHRAIIYRPSGAEK